MLHRHPPPPHGIRYLRLQLHGTNSRISPPARPDVLLYFHLFGSVGPRGGANLLATRLLHDAGRLRTLPFAGADRLTDALSFHFPFFPASASSPSWRGFRVRASVYTIPPMCNGSVPTGARANWFHCLPSAASEVHFCNFAPQLANFSSPQIKSKREKFRNLIKIRINLLFFFFLRLVSSRKRCRCEELTRVQMWAMPLPASRKRLDVISWTQQEMYVYQELMPLGQRSKRGGEEGSWTSSWKGAPSCTLGPWTKL